MQAFTRILTREAPEAESPPDNLSKLMVELRARKLMMSFRKCSKSLHTDSKLAVLYRLNELVTAEVGQLERERNDEACPECGQPQEICDC